MGSSGLRMGENLKSRPVPSGVQNFCTAPWGKYTKPRRGLMAAAVFASAVCAGIIASSNGSAIAAPAPCRTVRRERCFLVRNMALASRPSGNGRNVGGNLVRGLRRGRRGQLCRRRTPPECITGHDTQHQILEPVVVGLGGAHDVA